MRTGDARPDARRCLRNPSLEGVLDDDGRSRHGEGPSVRRGDVGVPERRSSCGDAQHRPPRRSVRHDGGTAVGDIGRDRGRGRARRALRARVARRDGHGRRRGVRERAGLVPAPARARRADHARRWHEQLRSLHAVDPIDCDRRGRRDREVPQRRRRAIFVVHAVPAGHGRDVGRGLRFQPRGHDTSTRPRDRRNASRRGSRWPTSRPDRDTRST